MQGMTLQSLINNNALFVVNDSGGKDSQAMKIKLNELYVPDRLMVTIHAHLPGVEWDGTAEHSEKYSAGKHYKVQAVKTFFEMVNHRKQWPSPKNRQCTSDLKRGPIEKQIRHISKETSRKLIVNCMGLRAEESPGRAKLETFKTNQRNSKAGREWYDWLPIHEMKEVEVFESIDKAGQKPHWVYREGMSRLSCCFCIMASTADLKIAAKLNPELYRKYVLKEKELDMTVAMPTKKGRQFLDERLNISI